MRESRLDHVKWAPENYFLLHVDVHLEMPLTGKAHECGIFVSATLEFGSVFHFMWKLQNPTALLLVGIGYIITRKNDYQRAITLSSVYFLFRSWRRNFNWNFESRFPFYYELSTHRCVMFFVGILHLGVKRM